MSNIKYQNLVIFTFKIRMKHKFSLSKKTNIIKTSNFQQYFHCFVVCILVPYACWFSYQQNIAISPISAGFRGTAFIRGGKLIRGRPLFQCGYSKVRRLLEGSAYLRPGAYYRTYGIQQVFICWIFPQLSLKILSKSHVILTALLVNFNNFL